ncbi:MAG TPA: hypothetical protein VN420_04545 [Candidatus Fimivivens sp.]|nr:hypothetical protein [Candidatus Fimivivens sp.]
MNGSVPVFPLKGYTESNGGRLIRTARAMEMNFPESVQDADRRRIAPETPPAAPAMDGNGATYGTGQGGGTDHIRFSNAGKGVENGHDDYGDSMAAVQFSEFEPTIHDDGSDAVSLL